MLHHPVQPYELLPFPIFDATPAWNCCSSGLLKHRLIQWSSAPHTRSYRLRMVGSSTGTDKMHPPTTKPLPPTSTSWYAIPPASYAVFQSSCTYQFRPSGDPQFLPRTTDCDRNVFSTQRGCIWLFGPEYPLPLLFPNPPLPPD